MQVHFYWKRWNDGIIVPNPVGFRPFSEKIILFVCHRSLINGLWLITLPFPPHKQSFQRSHPFSTPIENQITQIIITNFKVNIHQSIHSSTQLQNFRRSVNKFYSQRTPKKKKIIMLNWKRNVVFFIRIQDS